MPMDKATMLDLLVENALGFLSKAISEITEAPKFSIIHFYAAVELFIKARLMTEHWSLVVAKRQDPDWAKFISGDFQSVSLDEAANRLDKVARCGLSKQEHQAFRDIARHRNKVVHFFHEAHTTEESDETIRSIVKQQMYAWYFLHKLLTTKWNDEFSKWDGEISRLDKLLRELHEFLQVIYEQVKPEIEKKNGSGFIYKTCPSCGFDSQEHEDIESSVYESECLVCGLSENYLKIKCLECDEIVFFESGGFATCKSCGEVYEPKDVVDILIDDTATHMAVKDGDDSWDLGNCSNCEDYNTVVRLDEESYICTNCFVNYEYMNRCEWCGEPNTGDMEGSYWAGCSMCEGKSGWDKDD